MPILEMVCVCVCVLEVAADCMYVCTVALLSDVASLRIFCTGAFVGNGSDVFLLLML